MRSSVYDEQESNGRRRQAPRHEYSPSTNLITIGSKTLREEDSAAATRIQNPNSLDRSTYRHASTLVGDAMIVLIMVSWQSRIKQSFGTTNCSYRQDQHHTILGDCFLLLLSFFIIFVFLFFQASWCQKKQKNQIKKIIIKKSSKKNVSSIYGFSLHFEFISSVHHLAPI